MTQPILLSECRQGVLRLTLNDPASRNSLSDAMFAALEAALGSARIDPAVRAIVIAATGTVYCSGHNLKEITEHRGDPDRGRLYFRGLWSAVRL